MKPRLFLIHGGSTFRNNKGYLKFLGTREISIEKKNGWTNHYLDKELGKRFEIIRPRMPLQDNAKFRDWKIHFERHIPYLTKNTILLGQSLGGIFLAKYLSENKLPKKILSAYLVCAPFDDTLSAEELAGGFRLKSDLSLLDKSAKNLYLLFSKDDPIVPVTHADKYRNKLKNAKIIIYKKKNGHFQVPRFPEIIRLIKRDIRR